MKTNLHSGLLSRLLIGLTLVASSAACRRTATIAEGAPTLTLTSVSLTSGKFPRQSTCDGADTSPALAWSAPPSATQSFTLIAVDLDSPIGQFVHWVLYNLPPEQRELAAGLPKLAQLSGGALQGQNDFDKPGYGGPCPPGKSPHHYVFSLYAVDTKLHLPAGATRKQVEAKLRGHILARGELTGSYQH